MSADTSAYGTVLYRVNAETALLLGGARALLMQLALPGEGVRGDARARALAARVLRPVGWVPGARRPLEVLTSGLLPPSLRTAYGLPAPGRPYAALRSALRAGRRVAPRLVWEMPEARA